MHREDQRREDRERRYAADYWPTRFSDDREDERRRRPPDDYDRGAIERASDSVLSWLGDEDAERRRRLDRAREDYPESEIRRAVDGPLATRKPGAEFCPGGARDEGRPVALNRSRNLAGRGPRGYQRSDARIYEDLCERLTDHQEVDPSEVEVSVSNGEVTLTGTVESRYAKHLIQDIADSVSGVREVHSRLHVSQY